MEFYSQFQQIMPLMIQFTKPEIGRSAKSYLTKK